MAFEMQNLVAIGGGVLDYNTEDTKTEVLTAGYFNEAYTSLKKGLALIARTDLTGTPDLSTLIVTGVDMTTGTVTIVES